MIVASDSKDLNYRCHFIDCDGSLSGPQKENNCLENKFIIFVIIVSKLQTQPNSEAIHYGGGFFEAVVVILYGVWCGKDKRPEL